MSTYSEACAQWFTALRYEELPTEVVAATKLRMLDAIGLILAAGPTPLGRSAREAALAMGGGTGSRLLGFGDRVTPMCAVLANGALAQPPHTGAVPVEPDPSNINVVAALAVGEAVGVSGREAITAVAAAIELSARIGRAAAAPRDALGIATSGIRSTLSVAFAASRLLGLDIVPMRNAAGIAGAQASGILDCGDADDAWLLRAGWCGLSGVAAAFLAQAGCSGPAAVFETCVGPAPGPRTAGARLDLQQLTDDLGSVWHSRKEEENGAQRGARRASRAPRSDSVPERFRENAARMLKPGQVEAIIERLESLEQARSLQPMIELCVARER